MTTQRVGTCSLCGGNVWGFKGAWYGIDPPPPDTCRDCGAVSRSDVITMQPKPAGNIIANPVEVFTKIRK